MYDADVSTPLTSKVTDRILALGADGAENHGLQDILLACVDRLKGFPVAIATEYLQISKSWNTYRPNLFTLFKYTPEIRKAIYTTNAIESLNSVIRKATKQRKVFPTDESGMTAVYWVIQTASKKWTISIRNWKPAMSRFIVEFGHRLNGHLQLTGEGSYTKCFTGSATIAAA